MPRRRVEPLDLLAVGAHPDDVELFCGGTLARCSREGLRVGVVDLTEGELASRGTPATRRREARAASRVLGLATRENLGLEDGAVRGDDKSALDALVAVLRRLRPRVLILPPGVTRHPDHGEASRLGERAAFVAGLERHPGRLPPHRPGLVIYTMERWSFEPSFVVDVSEDHETKMEAIACYATQFSMGAESSQGTETFISRPEFIQALEARALHFGEQAGVRYAEPFLLRGLLPVAPSNLLEAARGPA